MRKHGYYWVKFEELGWVVCNWNNFKWLVPGNFDDLKMEEIDERRIERQPDCDDKYLISELENSKTYYIDRKEYQEFIEKVSKIMF